MKRFIAENREGSMVRRISGKSSPRRLATNTLFLGPLPESVCTSEKPTISARCRATALDGRIAKLTARIPY